MSDLSKTPSVSMAPLLDILTCVLVFLLLAHESPLYEWREQGLRLPTSSSPMPLKHTVTIAITRHHILVNRSRVLALDQLHAHTDRASGLIVPLFEKLKQAVARQKKISKY